MDAGIIAAALVFFGAVDVKDTPTKDGFSNEMANNIRAVRARYFSKVLKEFILTFIVDGTLYERHFANIQSLEEWEAVQRKQPVLGNGRFPCRFPGRNSSFKQDGVDRMRHELLHNPPHQQNQHWKALCQTQVTKILILRMMCLTTTVVS